MDAEAWEAVTSAVQEFQTDTDAFLTSDAFKPATDYVRQKLVAEHFPAFLESSSYRGIMRRTSVFLQADTHRKDRLSGEMTLESPFLTTVKNGEIPPLRALLDQNEIKFFLKFLEVVQGCDNILLFHQEVSELLLLPHTKTSYIQARCYKIFNKFVRRGGGMEIELPDDVRLSIMNEIAEPQQHIFDAANEHCLYVLEMICYPKFAASQYAVDMLESWQDNSSRRKASLDVIRFREILSFADNFTLFYSFLQAENCMKHLIFWKELEQFNCLPKSDYMKSQAKKIHTKYLTESAKHKIELSQDTIFGIEEGLLNVSPALYLEAQREVSCRGSSPGVVLFLDELFLFNCLF